MPIKEGVKMARYSLYEIIKPKLSPNVQKKLEEQMAYKDLVERRKKYDAEIAEEITDLC